MKLKLSIRGFLATSACCLHVVVASRNPVGHNEWRQSNNEPLHDKDIMQGRVLLDTVSSYMDAESNDVFAQHNESPHLRTARGGSMGMESDWTDPPNVFIRLQPTTPPSPAPSNEPTLSTQLTKVSASTILFTTTGTAMTEATTQGEGTITTRDDSTSSSSTGPTDATRTSTQDETSSSTLGSEVKTSVASTTQEEDEAITTSEDSTSTGPTDDSARTTKGETSSSTLDSEVATTVPTTTKGNPTVEEDDTSTPFDSTVFVSSAADIATAMQTAQPGDVLTMTNGEWRDEDIYFIGNGARGNPILLQAETPGSVVLTGSSRLHISGTFLVVDGLQFEGTTENFDSEDHVIEFRTDTSNLASNCRLTNTAIMDYNPLDSGNDYRWVAIYGSNNRVDHCYFSGKSHKGPLMIVWRPTAEPNNHKIDNNYFGDFSSGGGENGWETLRIGTSDFSLSDSFTTVERNLFLRCNGEIEIISVKSGGNDLRGNTFDSCQGTLTLRHGRGNTVDGNFFFGRNLPRTGGVRIIDSDHFVYNNYMENLGGSESRAGIVLANGLENSDLNEYFPVKRVTVAFNTIYGCVEAIRIGWESSSKKPVQVKDSTIANNAVVSFLSSGASSIIIEEDPPINMLYEGNFMYGRNVPLGISPTPLGINETDPILINLENDLYRPDPEKSSCIRGAVGLYPEVVSDIDGQTRRTTGKDVGADEVSSSHRTRRPLTIKDIGGLIGPSWMSKDTKADTSLSIAPSGGQSTEPNDELSPEPSSSSTLPSDSPSIKPSSVGMSPSVEPSDLPSPFFVTSSPSPSLPLLGPSSMPSSSVPPLARSNRFVATFTVLIIMRALL